MASIKTQLSAQRLLTDGTAVSLVVGSLIVGSLRYNAEMWLQDYPPDVRARYGSMSDRARRQQRLFALPFFLSFFGGLLYSTLKLKAENGGALSFRAAFVHVFLLYQFFVLFDTLVIDWFLIGWIQPEWVVLPGTEGMASYNDYYYTLEVTYLNPRPWLVAIVVSLIIASLARLIKWER
ncbi:MAG: hypothetical protein M3220_19960 [Chloroflexota bacterium]|nr:hypothetical protein [Chloroflexota bacterium]